MTVMQAIDFLEIAEECIDDESTVVATEFIEDAMVEVDSHEGMMREAVRCIENDELGDAKQLVSNVITQLIQQADDV